MNALQTTLADLSATLETVLASVHAGPRTPHNLRAYQLSRENGYGGTFEEWHDRQDAEAYHLEEEAAEAAAEPADPDEFERVWGDGE